MSTNEAASAPATAPSAARFFVALNGYDEPSLWEQVGGAEPHQIAAYWQLTTVHPVLWPVVVAAFTGAPDAVAAAVAAFEPRLPVAEVDTADFWSSLVPGEVTR